MKTKRNDAPRSRIFKEEIDNVQTPENGPFGIETALLEDRIENASEKSWR